MKSKRIEQQQLTEPLDRRRLYDRMAGLDDERPDTARGPKHQVRIPIAFFTTGLHPDYHRVTDTVDKIRFPKMARILAK